MNNYITGCVDKDTEYFNGLEWKKISNYTSGDQVLQYNEDGSANLVTPKEYIKQKSEGFYHFKTKFGLDMMLSKDHRNVIFPRNNNDYYLLTTEEIIDKHNELKNGFYHKFKTTFKYNDKGVYLSDNALRLCIASLADGRFEEDNPDICIISGYDEERYNKITGLLKKSKIKSSEEKAEDGHYILSYKLPIKHPKEKEFPKEWYHCTHHQMQIIFDEVFHWNSYEKVHNQYSSINEDNAIFVQFICEATGRRATINIDDRNVNPVYRVDWNDRTFVSISSSVHKADIPFIKSSDGYEYNFSVKSTMLVLRREGKIFITGAANQH